MGYWVVLCVHITYVGRLRKIRTSHLVAIMDTETYGGRVQRYIDYPMSDLLHIMGKASRQGIDSSGTCVIFKHLKNV